MQQKPSPRSRTQVITAEQQLGADRAEQRGVAGFLRWRLRWVPVFIEVICIARAANAHDLDATCRHANHLQSALVQLRCQESG